MRCPLKETMRTNMEGVGVGEAVLTGVTVVPLRMSPNNTGLIILTTSQ